MTSKPFRITDMKAFGVLAPQTGDVTAPTIPQNVVATAINAGRVDLSWTASTDYFGVSGYQIFRNGTPLNTTSLTSYTDSTCQPSTAYSYVIVAYDAVGNNSAPSTAANATTPANAAPVWQSIPAQTLIIGNAYLLTLTDYCTDADLDTITFSITAGTLPTGVVLSGTRLQGTPTVAGESPTITVQAADQFHQITTSITFSTKTADVTAPPVPTGLAATVVSSSQINVSWNASTDVAGSGNEYVSGTKDYRLYRDGSLRTTVNAPTTSYSDTGLVASTTYSYRITARDQQLNESAQSSAVTGTTQATGGLVNGASLVINGSGFGAKATPAPIIFDNFESYTAGNTLPSPWITTNDGLSGSVLPSCTTARSFSGTRSALLSFLGTQYNCYAARSLPDLAEVYYSYRFFRRKLGTVTTRNNKLTRCGGSPVETQDPGVGVTLTYDTGGSVYNFGPGTQDYGSEQQDFTDSNDFPAGKGPNLFDQWHRVEQWSQLSDPGVVNGHWSTTINLIQYNLYTSCNREVGEPLYQEIALPFYVAHDPGGDYVLYADEFWVDNTRQRIEIGNAATYAACTKRSPQPATAWSNTSITVTLNQGDQTSGSNAYGFLISAANTVTALGLLGVWA